MEEYTNNMQLSTQFNMFVGKIQDYPDELLISLSKIDKQWKDSENDLEKYMAQRRRKQTEKEKLDDQIDEIRKKHGVDPVTQAETAGITMEINTKTKRKTIMNIIDNIKMYTKVSFIQKCLNKIKAIYLKIKK